LRGRVAFFLATRFIKDFPPRGSLFFVRADEINHRVVAKNLPRGWGIPSYPVFFGGRRVRYIKIDKVDASKYKELALYRHFGEGKSWDASGYIEIMLDRARDGKIEDGCADRESVLRRCEALDELWEDVRSRGELRSHTEFSNAKSEIGGIQVMVRPDGSFAKIGGGNHRLMIAKIAGVQWVPVYFGAVHVGGWRRAYKRLRRPKG